MNKRFLAGLAVLSAVLLLSGCGTWETSSSVNVYGRIKHDISNHENRYSPIPEMEEWDILRNP